METWTDGIISGHFHLLLEKPPDNPKGTSNTYQPSLGRSGTGALSWNGSQSHSSRGDLVAAASKNAG